MAVHRPHPLRHRPGIGLKLEVVPGSGGSVLWRPESVVVLVRRKAAVGQPGAATATALKPVWTGLPVSLEKNGTYVKAAKEPKLKVDVK